jgi:FtsH-binding integral membrane protein
MKIETTKRDLLFWVMLILGIVSLSQFFAAPKYVSSTGILLSILISILSIAFFSLIMIYMTFRVYAQEKEKNNLKVEIKMYEWMYTKFRVSQEEVRV